MTYHLVDYRSVTGRFDPESAEDALRKFHGYVEPLRISTADQAWQMRRRVLDETYGQKRKLIMNILRLSPATIYQNTSAILAGTDLGNIQDFMDQVREYRKSFIQYLYNQQAFSSTHWFKYGDGETLDKPDLSSMPVFRQRDEGIASSLNRAATDMILLIILNAVFFILSCTLFVRQEIR